jgi:hypothetical protein
VIAIYESLELLGIRADYPGFGTQTTGYSGFSSRWDQIFSSRLCPDQLWFPSSLLGALSPGLNRQGRETDFSTPPCA